MGCPCSRPGESSDVLDRSPPDTVDSDAACNRCCRLQIRCCCEEEQKTPPDDTTHKKGSDKTKKMDGRQRQTTSERRGRSEQDSLSGEAAVMASTNRLSPLHGEGSKMQPAVSACILDVHKMDTQASSPSRLCEDMFEPDLQSSSSAVRGFCNPTSPGYECMQPSPIPPHAATTAPTTLVSSLMVNNNSNNSSQPLIAFDSPLPQQVQSLSRTRSGNTLSLGFDDSGGRGGGGGGSGFPVAMVHSGGSMRSIFTRSGQTAGVAIGIAAEYTPHHTNNNNSTAVSTGIETTLSGSGVFLQSMPSPMSRVSLQGQYHHHHHHHHQRGSLSSAGSAGQAFNPLTSPVLRSATTMPQPSHPLPPHVYSQQPSSSGAEHHQPPEMGGDVWAAAAVNTAASSGETWYVVPEHHHHHHRAVTQHQQQQQQQQRQTAAAFGIVAAGGGVVALRGALVSQYVLPSPSSPLSSSVAAVNSGGGVIGINSSSMPVVAVHPPTHHAWVVNTVPSQLQQQQHHHGGSSGQHNTTTSCVDSDDDEMVGLPKFTNSFAETPRDGLGGSSGRGIRSRSSFSSVEIYTSPPVVGGGGGGTGGGSHGQQPRHLTQPLRSSGTASVANDSMTGAATAAEQTSSSGGGLRSGRPRPPIRRLQINQSSLGSVPLARLGLSNSVPSGPLAETDQGGGAPRSAHRVLPVRVNNNTVVTLPMPSFRLDETTTSIASGKGTPSVGCDSLMTSNTYSVTSQHNNNSNNETSITRRLSRSGGGLGAPRQESLDMPPSVPWHYNGTHYVEMESVFTIHSRRVMAGADSVTSEVEAGVLQFGDELDGAIVEDHEEEIDE